MEKEMTANRIPLLYFLPTVIMIDDNKSFLENFGMELNYDGLLKTYTDPLEAAERLITCDNMFKNWEEYICVIDNNETDSDLEMRAVNYDTILKTASDPNRFHEPAIVIVDYSMPEINGIDFCKKIAKYPCKKIMLTGEADYEIAVNAFNEGLIDKFILKDVDTKKLLLIR